MLFPIRTTEDYKFIKENFIENPNYKVFQTTYHEGKPLMGISPGWYNKEVTDLFFEGGNLVILTKFRTSSKTLVTTVISNNFSVFLATEDIPLYYKELPALCALRGVLIDKSNIATQFSKKQLSEIHSKIFDNPIYDLIFSFTASIGRERKVLKVHNFEITTVSCFFRFGDAPFVKLHQTETGLFDFGKTFSKDFRMGAALKEGRAIKDVLKDLSSNE